MNSLGYHVLSAFVLLLAIAVAAAAVVGYEGEPEELNLEREERRDQEAYHPDGEFPEEAFDYVNQLKTVKRNLYVQTRAMKSCGGGKFCDGTCCGKTQCCKKGWTCRYMPRIRSFYCIP